LEEVKVDEDYFEVENKDGSTPRYKKQPTLDKNFNISISYLNIYKYIENE
jgi:hypothetical protein